MVGSAIVRRIEALGKDQVLVRSRQDLDLTDQHAVDRFFRAERPDQVYLAAAKVGGILANSTHPAAFIRDNLAIQTNVIHAAFQHGTRKLLFLGSSCIYPKLATQPLKEDALLTGPLEPTNEAYAIAKIAGVKMCQAYRQEHGFDAISLMPTNLYGPGDNYDLQSSHVLAAMIRKFHDAKVAGNGPVLLWGTGTPKREFLHVDDLAEACLHLMGRYSGADLVNVGTGKDLSIRDLAALVQRTVGHSGPVQWDASKPDGTPRKLLDVSRLTALGWKASTPLEAGIAMTYATFQAEQRVAAR